MILSDIKSRIKVFFSNGHERTIRAKKNIAISVIVRGLGMLIGFILIPLTIKYVSSDQYGIWITLSSIIGWFNFFDIGLGSGLKNKIAEANALGDNNIAKIYVSTTYAILAVISILLFTVFAFLNTYLNWSELLNIQHDGIRLNQITVIVFGSFCLQFVLQLINVVLTATHDTSKVSFIGFLGQFTSLVIVVILIYSTTGSLLYLVLALAGGPVLIQLFATIWFYVSKYKYLAPSFKFVHLKHAKSLLGLGGAFFLIQIGGLVLFQTDSIIIIRIFGSKDVTTYNVAYKLFSVIIMLFTIIMTPFWSAFTDAYTKNDINWIQDIFKKMYKYWFILSGFTLMLLLLSPIIYKIWLGNNIEVPFLLSCSMALYAIGYCWLMIHCFLLNGIGKIRLQLYMYIISTLINIPIAILLAKVFGIAGVTLSNVIVFVYMGIVLYIQCKKIINKTATGVWAR